MQGGGQREGKLRGQEPLPGTEADTEVGAPGPSSAGLHSRGGRGLGSAGSWISTQRPAILLHNPSRSAGVPGRAVLGQAVLGRAVPLQVPLAGA